MFHINNNKYSGVVGICEERRKGGKYTWIKNGENLIAYAPCTWDDISILN